MAVDRTASGADQCALRVKAHIGVQTTPSRNLVQFCIPNFVDSAACAELIALIDANARPSTLADAGDDPEFRTSTTCDLEYHIDVVARLDAALSELTGINPVFGEPLQGQRYEVGQQFKYHTDYFEPNGYDFAEHCSLSGQRTWTVMLYLNTVTAGGGTRFQSTGKMFKPEAGKLLLWDNLDAVGSPNPHTLHHGMKVRAGRKYIITKWYRERPWPWPVSHD
jgi:prolyl 4-hydroxylase